MRAKVVTLLCLLALVAIILHVRGNQDLVVFSQPLGQFPLSIGPWQGRDLPLAQDVLQVLGDGRFLTRSYGLPQNAAVSAPSIDLLIAYFPSQRNGQTVHSPQNCLPGAGWTFESSGRLNLTDNAGKPHRVGEYLVTNGAAKFEVLYWYRSRGHDIASDYAAKGYLLVQAIRDQRTDGALIRIMTPLTLGETQAHSRIRMVDFTAAMDPLLAPYLPE